MLKEQRPPPFHLLSPIFPSLSVGRNSGAKVTRVFFFFFALNVFSKFRSLGKNDSFVCAFNTKDIPRLTDLSVPSSHSLPVFVSRTWNSIPSARLHIQPNRDPSLSSPFFTHSHPKRYSSFYDYRRRGIILSAETEAEENIIRREGVGSNRINVERRRWQHRINRYG